MDATTTCHMSISLDGYVAGPDQNLEHPLGRGGMDLHRWHLEEPLNDADTQARDLLLRPRGAYVMGRNMFGPIRGPWQDDWRGWWGDDPPYHAPLRCSPSPTTTTRRSPWPAGRPSTSSPRDSTPRSRAPRRPRATEASTSRAEPPRCARRSRARGSTS